MVVVTLAKLPMPEIYMLVEVMLVAERVAGANEAAAKIPETYKLVEVAPIPTMVRPPKMVVETPVAPIRTPPKAPPVPMAMVVVPGPVPILMVEEVPMPKERVWATEELPTVIRPVP